MGAIDNPYQASLVTNMAQSPVGHYANATSHISLRKTIVTSPDFGCVWPKPIASLMFVLHRCSLSTSPQYSAIFHNIPQFMNIYPLVI